MDLGRLSSARLVCQGLPKYYVGSFNALELNYTWFQMPEAEILARVLATMQLIITVHIRIPAEIKIDTPKRC